MILLVASWVGRRQGEAIECCAPRTAYCAPASPPRLRFADAERRLLAEKGKPLGRKLLAEMASPASPETILRWYREQVAAKYDGNRARGSGRPATRADQAATDDGAREADSGTKPETADADKASLKRHRAGPRPDRGARDRAEHHEEHSPRPAWPRVLT